jgi:hypothetical protein
MSNGALQEYFGGLQQQNTSINTLNGELISTRQQLNLLSQEYNRRLQQQNTSIGTLHGELISKTQQLNSSVQVLFEGLLYLNASSSCAVLPPFSPSGYYWVRASNGSAVRVYCDMTRLCGGVTGGWMRVAELDMTNSSHQCPSGLRQRTDSNIRTCVRIEESRGCSSDYTNSYGIGYTKVRGRIIGYQFSQPEAFNTGSSSIDAHYVDGVSLTHGSPRQHIWTFAAAYDEVSGQCPCSNTGLSPPLPPRFVGHDYFCDAGITANKSSMLTTLCGMVLVAGLRAHAALLTILHGSTSSCHSPPLMILR